ncbi:DNA-binding protein [Citricoccus sp. GCM10030269]|uniref:DNA-binding protein n=1 Tax=Citricoccus sp. GCM10030269 TaxID=3273388 RepID=UPI00362158DF
MPTPSSPEAEQHLAQQRALYGTSLSERFGALMSVYGLSQRALARVVGLSAPMLSQLINAQRIKIGNPAVYERLVMLEERQDEQDLGRVLTEVEASEPVLSTNTSRGRSSHTLATGSDPERGAADLSARISARLRQLASPDQLRSTADAARQSGAASLAELLERAAAED